MGNIYAPWIFSVDIYPTGLLSMDNYAPSIDIVDINATIRKRG